PTVSKSPTAAWAEDAAPTVSRPTLAALKDLPAPKKGESVDDARKPPPPPSAPIQTLSRAKSAADAVVKAPAEKSPAEKAPLTAKLPKRTPTPAKPVPPVRDAPIPIVPAKPAYVRR